MSKTHPPGYRSDTGLMNALLHRFDITAEDLKSNWIDLMVKRLLAELNRQLCEVESEKKETAVPLSRLENARVLASLENTVERLVRVEAQREVYRKGKNVANNKNARKALERKLDQLVAAEEEAEDSTGRE